MKVNIKKTFGFTLIEVIVAMALSAILGIALIAMVLQAQAIANSARLRNQATKYAEQLIEQTRAFRNQDWTNFYTKVPTSGGTNENCYKDTSFVSGNPKSTSCALNPTDSSSIAVTIFSQSIGLMQVSANIVRVNAYIFYNDRGVAKTVTSSTILTNLQ